MMAKTKIIQLGMNASLNPKLSKLPTKKSKVYGFTIPKFGRFAFTSDPGETPLFFSEKLRTSLGAIVRDPSGRIVDEFDLGSGLITNIGVTALANDSNWTTEMVEPLNTLNVMKYVNWGTGTGEAEKFNWKLETQAENESGKKKAVAATSSTLVPIAAGNAKIIITAKLEANLVGPTAITEWGLFSGAETEGAGEKAATATTSSTLEDSVKFESPYKEESKIKVRGAQQYVIWAKEKGAAENEDIYGLVTKNTETTATVAQWIKGGSAALQTPYSKTKYKFYPVMWDRRKFSAINVEKGNQIEFPYELTIES